ncbi:MAG TPA: hypothetical protein VFY87_12330, partial [Geminicoccaceae bacterium]|nr:hypothetical protein [Geminicoccaceae bacterium]
GRDHRCHEIGRAWPKAHNIAFDVQSRLPNERHVGYTDSHWAASGSSSSASVVINRWVGAMPFHSSFS